MKIVCKSLDHFLTNLQQEKTTFKNLVFVFIDKTPKDVSNTVCRYQVVFHAAAIVIDETGAEYMLEMAEDCGIDYVDASQDFAGSEVASEKNDRLIAVCNTLGLTIRPGLIEE